MSNRVRNRKDFLATDSTHHLQTEWLQGLLLPESKLQQARNNALHSMDYKQVILIFFSLIWGTQRVIENLE